MVQAQGAFQEISSDEDVRFRSDTSRYKQVLRAPACKSTWAYCKARGTIFLGPTATTFPGTRATMFLESVTTIFSGGFLPFFWEGVVIKTSWGFFPPRLGGSMCCPLPSLPHVHLDYVHCPSWGWFWWRHKLEEIA